MTLTTESTSFLHRASEIFADALELPAGDGREQFVVQACKQWPEHGVALQAKVRELLHRHDTPGHLLRPTQFSGAVAVALDADAAKTANAQWLGQSLGAYQIDSLIARGGMGWVFKGHRADAAYAQDVAIKLVRDSGDRSRLAERFRAERQILASLEHPNIARLLDGGSTQQGEPYLVMEYVDGEPITQYIIHNKLDIPARLALFRTVCAAVHFAHQRLVVHRDLKPSNIFVSRTGEVKLLDFGIAKVLEAEASNATPNTIVALTPAYASPEQIKGETITTASDVYALGVLLFELLTGQSPYKSKPTQSLDLAREICDAEPERPSTVVGRDTATDLHIDVTRVKRLQRGLRGDLDNIVLMALRKDPARRYASAEQLSEDVLRFVNQQPVLARLDTWRYRAKKFVMRNTWPVALGGAASIALLIVTVFATHQASVARAEKLRAEKHFASVRQFANFTLTDLHRGIKDLPGSAPVRKQLIQAALGYLDELAKDAGHDAKLLGELGGGYLSLAEIQGIAVTSAQLGEQSDARRSLDRATELLSAAHTRAPRDADIAYTYALSLRKRAEYEWSLTNFDAAASAINRAIEIGQSAVDTGIAATINRIELAGALITQARTSPAARATRAQRGQPLRRAQVILEALTLQSLSAADANRVATNLAISYDALGEIIADKDRPESLVEAYELTQKSLVIAERRSSAEPSNKSLQFSLGASYHQSAAVAGQLKRAADAIEFRRKSLAVYEQLLQLDARDKNARMHVVYASALLAEAHAEENQMDAAEPLLVRGERMQSETDAESAKQVFHRAAAMLLPAVRAVVEAHRVTVAGIAPSAKREGCKRAIDSFKQARLSADGLKDLFLDQAEDPLAEVKKRMQVCAAVTQFPL